MAGGSLDQWLDWEGKLSVDRAIKIVIDICQGLIPVHKKGIVHRDIKPTNILLGKDSEIVKISGWTIAHLPPVKQTLGGQPDTLFYMSTEQALANIERSDKSSITIDRRSDIYSLGATLFRMVTGEFYLDFKRILAEAEQELRPKYSPYKLQWAVQQAICQAIVEREPERPTRYNPDLPTTLEAVILKALAKEPRDRYQTAEKMIEALQQVRTERKPPQPEELIESTQVRSEVSMGKAIGIYLGATNSVMAILQDGKPVIIQNINGTPLTPSVVGFSEDGELLVGAEAKAQAVIAPKNTIFSIKRFMGRLYADEDVQEDIRMVPYEVTEAENGEVAVWLNGKAYSPIEISAFILETLKHNAEEQIGEITHAVITVPAYFGQRQREATRDAGRLAGLKVMRLLPEPTAAALAYDFGDQAGEDKTILVYDLGGSTFDVTVMLVSGGNFVDLAKTGDNHLGGDNFDQELIKHIIEQTRRQQGVDLQHNREALQKLKQAAETAKITLSSRRGQARITIAAIAQDERGEWINIQMNLTQDEYEAMIRPYIKRTIDLVHQAIREADCLPEDIDHILLVGGSTLTPLVVESLRAEFGDEKILRGVNPMECVAAGAAIQAGPPFSDSEGTDWPAKECPQCSRLNILERMECRYCGYRFKEIITPQTIAKPLGIKIEGDKMEVIIPKGTIYPTEEPITRYFYTIRPNQTIFRILVYEGFEEIASQNELLGVVEAELPPVLPNATEVAVSFSLDCDGILYVTAKLPDQPEVKIEAKLNFAARTVPPQPGDEAGLLGGSDSSKKIRKSLGIQVAGGRMEVVVPKNTLCPTTKAITRSFVTVQPNQTSLRLPVYEGENEIASQNEYLGEAQGDLPPGLPDATEVIVSFSLDADGIIYVTAQLPGHPEVKIQATFDWKYGKGYEAREDTVLKEHMINRFRSEALATATGGRDEPPQGITGAQPRRWRQGELIVGRYQIYNIIESGGMGMVFLCYDREARAPVAIKTYKETGHTAESDHLAQLFESEALVWVQLGRHPHIVRAKYVIKLTGRPYLFMEFVGGPEGEDASLRQLLQTKPIDVPTSLHLAIQVCAGMEHATQVFPGLVHRDLKPENLLLTSDNILKITDFGLTKVFADFSNYPSEFAGTVPYMSPEQCLGLSHLDIRSDIYALGVILYEMLTGQRPFQGKSVDDFVRAHLVTIPASPNSLNPSIPEPVSQIVMKCLCKRPEDRFNSFTELKANLISYYEVATGHPPTLPPFEEPVEPRSSVQATAALARAISLASLGRYDEAMIAFDLALEYDPNYAYGWFSKGVVLSGLGRVEEAATCFDKAVTLDPRDTEAWLEKGRILVRSGRRVEALDCFNRTLRLHPWHPKGYYEKGVTLFFLSRYNEAAKCFSQVERLESRSSAKIMRETSLREGSLVKSYPS